MDPKPPNSKVQVVVIGDPSTGKSSLIISAMTQTFLEEVPSLLLPTSLPMDTFPDCIPVTIIDTSSDPEHLNDTFKACQTADVIVLTYSYDTPSTLERLTAFWLPELRRHNISIPVIVTGCKLDLTKVDEEDFKQKMFSLMEQFGEVKTGLGCSALDHKKAIRVFYKAQKLVLYPTSPLLDEENRKLRPKLISALKRIFILCDQDHDGVLNDDEINNYHIKYYGTHFQPREISEIKKSVQDRMAEGCSDDGLTLTGFLVIQAMMIKKGRIENVWDLLRKCGYNNNIMLKDDDYGDDVKELRDETVIFLSECFYNFDEDKDGSLSTDDLENLFSTAPGKPDWFNGSEEMMSLDRFISKWALMALSDPVITFAYLKYIGYAEEDLNLAFRDRNSERSCFQCFVFGPEKAGKSALLNWLVGKPFSEEYIRKKAMDLLVQFATRCENSGYQVPCFIVSILPVSSKLRNNSNLFSRIVYVAQNPQMFIPKTEDGIKRKQRGRLMKHTLVFGSVAVATVALAGLNSSEKKPYRNPRLTRGRSSKSWCWVKE